MTKCLRRCTRPGAIFAMNAFSQKLSVLLSRHGALETRTLLSLLAIVGGTWGFLKLASEVQEGDTHAFDVWAVRSLRQPGNTLQPIGPTWLPEIARDITALGGGSLLIIFCGIVVGFLCLRRKFRAVWFLLASLLGGTSLDYSLKAFYARPRPSVVLHLTAFDSASFPSGHSMLAAIAYLTLGVVLARLAEGRGARIYFLTVGSMLAFLVGVSRVYLGVHYPTDVLAGWTLGLVWALVCSLVARNLQRTRIVEPPAADVAGRA